MRQNLIALALAALLSPAAHATNFFDGFDGSGGPNGASWETANWANGDIFGCTFAYSEAWLSGAGNLILNVNSSAPGNVKCGEIRTWQSFTYGKFTTRLQPGTIAGSDTSFFLYSGTAGTPSHFEIDIEFVNAGKTLHTNVWKADVQNYKQFAVSTGWRTIGFEWRPTYVRWFSVSDSGAETEIRRVATNVSTPMRLMLNHWVGNNSAGALNFVGQYNGGGGSAYYDWVKVSD
ncbi:MAG: family 16 glycosylhydrolase [Betaproteobacteria bacterium]